MPRPSNSCNAFSLVPPSERITHSNCVRLRLRVLVRHINRENDIALLLIVSPRAPLSRSLSMLGALRSSSSPTSQRNERYTYLRHERARSENQIFIHLFMWLMTLAYAVEVHRHRHKPRIVCVCACALIRSPCRALCEHHFLCLKSAEIKNKMSVDLMIRETESK